MGERVTMSAEDRTALLAMWKNPNMRPMCNGAMHVAKEVQKGLNLNVVIQSFDDLAVLSTIQEMPDLVLMVGNGLLQLLQEGAIKDENIPSAN